MTKNLALQYSDGDTPGYRRVRRGRGFVYLQQNGRPIRSAKTIIRLNALALPPAYTDTWYAKDPRAHLQATGIDARGRKQYRYHPEFRLLKEDEKFGRCVAFGKALPRIRKAVEGDLSRRDLSRERIVAAVMRLLDLGSVRVGNIAYARTNRSFGATTLRNRHAEVNGSRVRLDYVGKSGRRHRIGLEDARLARIVRKCLDLPGHTLSQYEGEDGKLHPVCSQDVNQWLCNVTGGHFTAKHFRTWAASAMAFEALARSKGQTKLKPVLELVSKRLGNTPAIARKSYIHPAIIEVITTRREDIDWRLPRATRYHSPAERGLLNFLEAECSVAA